MKSILPLVCTLALTALACGAKPASVAINPISGNVFATHEANLHSCEPGVKNCTEQKLSFQPVSAAVGQDGGLVFLTSSAIHRCDDAGQNCSETKLPIGDAVGVSVAASGQVVVVSSKGGIAVCDNAGCQKADPSKK